MCHKMPSHKDSSRRILAAVSCILHLDVQDANALHISEEKRSIRRKTKKRIKWRKRLRNKLVKCKQPNNAKNTMLKNFLFPSLKMKANNVLKSHWESVANPKFWPISFSAWQVKLIQSRKFPNRLCCWSFFFFFFCEQPERPLTWTWTVFFLSFSFHPLISWTFPKDGCHEVVPPP